MKRRRAILLTGMTLLVIVAVPSGVLLREYHHEELNRSLIAAIKADDISTASRALTAGADANARDYSSAPRSIVAIVKRLMDKTLVSNAKSPLPPSAIELLFAGTPSKAPGLPPKLARSFVVPPKDHVSLLTALLDHGADPNTRIEDGLTPLMEAARWGYTDYIDALIRHGADVNAKSMGAEFTPLHMAFGRRQVISQLVIAGADINSRDSHGETPLIMYVSRPGPSSVQPFLDFDSDVNACDKLGNTALDHLRTDSARMRQTLLQYKNYEQKVFHREMQRHLDINTYEIERELLHAGAKIGKELDNPVSP